MPLYIDKIVNSLQSRIFVSCPVFDTSRACQKMKDIIDTCVKDKLVMETFDFLDW